MIFDAYMEIPAGSSATKYEKVGDQMRVSRILDTPLLYPANYGFIPHTLAEDGDELDVLVITPQPLYQGTTIQCRALGVLLVEDQDGIDNKIIAVPAPTVCRAYDKIEDYTHLPPVQKLDIEDFFSHYKDNEPVRWSKVNGWDATSRADCLIDRAQVQYKIQGK